MSAMEISYSSRAEADLARLQPSTAERVAQKVQWYVSQDDPLRFAKPLQGSEKIFRFRIGHYRVIFTLQCHEVVILIVLAVKHRREAYR